MCLCGDGRQEPKHLDLAAFVHGKWDFCFGENRSEKKISEIVSDSGKLISLSEKKGRQVNFGNASFPYI